MLYQTNPQIGDDESKNTNQFSICTEQDTEMKELENLWKVLAFQGPPTSALNVSDFETRSDFSELISFEN